MPRHILATFTVVTFVHLEEHEVSVQYVFPGIITENDTKVQQEIIDDWNAELTAEELDEGKDPADWDSLMSSYDIDFRHYRAHEVQTASRKEVRDRHARIERGLLTPSQLAVEQEVLKQEIRVEEGQ